MAKARQQKLQGLAEQSIPEIESAALSYVEARDQRMQLTELETERKADLLKVMTKHGKTTYRIDEDPPLVVSVVDGDPNVKVRREKKQALEPASEKAASASDDAGTEKEELN